MNTSGLLKQLRKELEQFNNYIQTLERLERIEMGEPVAGVAGHQTKTRTKRFAKSDRGSQVATLGSKDITRQEPDFASPMRYFAHPPARTQQ
jgi:hypothetical protein